MQYRAVTVLAPAKLNLSLDVVGTLPNGYHDLDMVMQTIDLYEKITLRRSNDLTLTLPGSFVPANDKNTAVKAALAFFHYTGLLAGVDMTIYKRVPVRAGMAGGSADAAGVLVGLNELYNARLSMSELCAIGAGIGQCCFETDGDVPQAMRAALGAAAEPYIEQRGAKWHVDLKGINAHWLRADGVEQIDVCAHCTACRPDLYWSHRRMGNARGAQIAMIALR